MVFLVFLIQAIPFSSAFMKRGEMAVATIYGTTVYTFMT